MLPGTLRGLMNDMCWIGLDDVRRAYRALSGLRGNMIIINPGVFPGRYILLFQGVFMQIFITLKG